jgi:hypothetical protein
MKFHLHWAGAALCVVALTVSTVAHAAPVSGQGTWETTLQGRDLDGNLSTFEAYYDTALNITWLADANYAGTTMDWTTANNWAASLNFNGITSWRLPVVGPVNGSSFNYSYGYDGTTDDGFNMGALGTPYAGSTGSEMAHLFYTTLGNTAYCDTSGVCPQVGYSFPDNTGPFSNIQYFNYWSATEYADYQPENYAWDFAFDGGSQQANWKANNFFSVAWAVHPGDVGAVATVPVPAAVWLFGSGLLGLIGFARRKKRAV